MIVGELNLLRDNCRRLVEHIWQIQGTERHKNKVDEKGEKTENGRDGVEDQ